MGNFQVNVMHCKLHDSLITDFLSTVAFLVPTSAQTIPLTYTCWMSECTDNTGKFLQVKKVKSREVDWLTTCHLKSGTSEFIIRVTAPMSHNGVSEFSLFPLWFVHPNWENEKQSRYWMGKTHLDNPCKWEELFSNAPSFLQSETRMNILLLNAWLEWYQHIR